MFPWARNLPRRWIHSRYTAGWQVSGLLIPMYPWEVGRGAGELQKWSFIHETVPCSGEALQKDC